MERERFIYLCQESDGGRDAFAAHPSTHEEGFVTSCSMESGTLQVRTPDNQMRSWDFQECEELPLIAGITLH
ncbi:MAG: hypothetical protein A2091_00510 [Desulfuromonadales bacterium GWD2_61_12]|nr:MAG: hypothetical protein A2005_08535 [Desulfuromonadales bacterium GWC2_61_20]OGR32747.1 MAG: hypothetical protein A2091_00510 [Desulfuromonadales bacterium GWD2_61_12]HAD03159.1 hypothetical protein [Desulfuromonas sp.]HBT83343.1 hypothetical protein [Desulfuromonas sp.]